MDTWDVAVMGAGHLVCGTGVHTQGVVGASVVELCAQGVTLLFCCVMVHLGIIQMGCGGGMSLPSRCGASSGLTAGPGVHAMSPGSGLTRVGVWVVGVVSAGAPVAGVHAHSAMSPFDRVMAGLGSM